MSNGLGLIQKWINGSISKPVELQKLISFKSCGIRKKEYLI